MAARPADVEVASGPPPRTGPVGRAVRTLLVVVGAWFTYHVWVRRGFIFTHPDPLLTVVALFTSYQAAGMFGRVRLVLGVLIASAVAAAGLAVAWHGGLWAPPLSWLVWGAGQASLALATVGMLGSVFLGTPGCELAVFAELAPGLRRRGMMSCLVGLHLLDDWEARRSWRRDGG